MSAQEQADWQWQGEAREALYENVGFHPRHLDHEAIVARGGDYYGDYYLYKCPKCGHPFLLECEADRHLLDLNDLKKESTLPGTGESMPCPECGHTWVGGEIANHHDLAAYKEWLITPQELRERGLDWIVRRVAVSPPDRTT